MAEMDMNTTCFAPQQIYNNDNNSNDGNYNIINNIENNSSSNNTMTNNNGKWGGGCRTCAALNFYQNWLQRDHPTLHLYAQCRIICQALHSKPMRELPARGTWYLLVFFHKIPLGVFHLMDHAFPEALLFLNAGWPGAGTERHPAVGE